ncbi:unnamed protein product, partial [Tetraodon nigroviridis]
AEILEMAGNAARDKNKRRITPRHMKLAVANDDEPNQVTRQQVTDVCRCVCAYVHTYVYVCVRVSEPVRAGSCDRCGLTCLPPACVLVSAAPEGRDHLQQGGSASHPPGAALQEEGGAGKGRGRGSAPTASAAAAQEHEGPQNGQRPPGQWSTGYCGPTCTCARPGRSDVRGGQRSQRRLHRPAGQEPPPRTEAFTDGERSQQDGRHQGGGHRQPHRRTLAVGQTSGMAAGFILHCHAPQWGWDQSEQQLERTVRNCLWASEDRPLTSVAFPPLPAARNGFPRQTAAQLVLKAICSHFVSSSSSSLKNILLCDSESISVYLQEMAKLDAN